MAVDKGLMTIHKADEHPSLAAYRDSFVNSFQKRMDTYEQAKKVVLEKPEKYGDLVLEPPMQPNKLQAYPADLFGLDEAKRDCRFEMIKIVREVSVCEFVAFTELLEADNVLCTGQCGQFGSQGGHRYRADLAICRTQYL